MANRIKGSVAEAMDKHIPGNPATSQAQQQFMGIVHGIQKGEISPSYSSKAAKVARTMKHSDVEEFAATRRKRLPK